MFKYLTFCSFLLSTTAFAEEAQQAPPPDAAADAGASSILVTATRLATPVDQVPASVTVLDKAAIDRAQDLGVTELLLRTPGVSISRNGGYGTATSLRIRGAESDQTVVVIDGVKLNDPSSAGGGYNFANLLVGDASRIEVLRGPQSTLWGSQAIGGVVNLITRQPTEELAINARAEGGSFGTGQAFANVSGKSGAVSASLGGGFFTTDGISAYAPGREKDGYRNYGANGSVAVALADNVSVDVRGFYSNGRTEIDGFPAPTFSFGDTREVGNAEQWTGYTGLNAALFDGRFRNRIGYAHTSSNRTNTDPDGTPTETFRGKGRNDRIDYQGSFDVTDAVFATFGVEREVSRFTTASFGGPATTGRARLFGVYGQLAVTPIENLTDRKSVV